MKFKQVDVISLKNRPFSRKEREDERPWNEQRPEAYSLVFRVVAVVDGQQFIGLGECRPSRISNEILRRSHRHARRIARYLPILTEALDWTLGDSDSLEDAPRQVHELVQRAVSELFGFADTDERRQRPTPSIFFGLEMALLDVIAKSRGMSVAEMTTGSSSAVVKRNVFSDRLKNPEALIKDIRKGKALSGWLRLSRRIDTDRAVVLLNFLRQALAEQSTSIDGVILSAGQRWSAEDWDSFCEAVKPMELEEAGVGKVIIEDPFPEESDAFYLTAFERCRDLPVRIMLSRPVWGCASLEPLSAYLPYVDLRVTPQKVGGFHETLRLEQEAIEAGFQGSIYLGNVPSSTNLNTLALMTLASAMPSCDMFSAGARDDGRVRLVYPTPAERSDELHFPEGAGWCVNLCRSGVRKRMAALNAYDNDGRVSEWAARKSLMKSVLDDRFVSRPLAQGEGEHSDAAIKSLFQGKR
jgi:L-alanine-DL-glutamate epimerase-like enolase superfamily enzyme